MTSTDLRTECVQSRLLKLRSAFIYNEPYASLSVAFDRLIETRRYELSAKEVTEARGIVVVGASGSGKTTAVEHLIRNHVAARDVVAEIPTAEIVSVRVPSPATVKQVGMTTLHSLGYPMVREPSAAIIWNNVRARLQLRQTLFVHFDEAQDFFSNQNGRELQAVINTVKSLMQDKEWPVGIILSGMPVLVEMINKDPQLSRRLRPIFVSPIDATTHGLDVANLVRKYAKMADLEAFEEHTENEFVQRLIKAAGEQFGLTIEMIIAAVEDALHDGSTSLNLQHFARSFRTRTGCLDGRNPFLAEEFRSFQSLKILDDVETEI